MIDFSQMATFYIGNEGIKTLYINGSKVWEKPTVVLNGLAFTAKQANSTIKLTAVGTPDAISLEYSTNNGSTYSTYTVGDTITISSVGKKVLFRAGSSGNSKIGKDGSNYYKFVATGNVSVDGTKLNYLLKQDGNPSTIPNYCFYGLFYQCSKLTGELDLSNITSSNQYTYSVAFRQTGITTANLSGLTNPGARGLEGIFNGCKSLVSIDLSGLTSITQGYAFNSLCMNASNLKSVDLHNLTSVGLQGLNGAFRVCTSLETIDLSKITTLSDSAMTQTFRDCSSLKTVKMNKVSTTGTSSMRNCFLNCTSLQVVDFSEATSVPTLTDSTTFIGTNSTFKIVVPDSLYSSWIAASNWSTYASQIVKASEYTPA